MNQKEKFFYVPMLIAILLSNLFILNAIWNLENHIDGQTKVIESIIESKVNVIVEELSRNK